MAGTNRAPAAAAVASQSPPRQLGELTFTRTHPQRLSIFGVQTDIEAFMAAMGQAVPDTPQVVSNGTLRLRIDLITEEFDELIHELHELERDPDHTRIVELGRLAKIAKEICDLVYVAVGTASTMGIDLEEVWEAVHESNMEKAGGPVRPDGKRLKPEGWTPPDITSIIREQQAESDFADRSIG